MRVRGDYWARAAVVSAQLRKTRLQSLRAQRAEIAEAGAASSIFRSPVQLIDQGTFAEPESDLASDHTLIPQNFVRGTGTSSPMSSLIARRGEAIRVYCLLNFLDQSLTLDTSAVRSINEIPLTRAKSRPTWPALLAFPQTLDARAATARMHRAFAALEDVGVIRMPPVGVRGRYREVALVRGRSRANGVHLPLHAFTRGWLNVLTPPELAVYLMLRDVRDVHRRRRAEPVFVPRSRRLAVYGISDEVYLAHRALSEFGLISTIDPMRERKRGRTVPNRYSPLLPFEFVINRGAFVTGAYDAVVTVLTHNLVPPRHRISEWGSIRHALPQSARRSTDLAETPFGENGDQIDNQRADDVR